METAPHASTDASGVRPRPSANAEPSASLGWSVADGAFHAVMLGAGECFLSALAVELGHRGAALAVLLTMPQLVGALAQLASGPLTRALGSYRRVVVAGAVLQAASHMVFMAIALLGVRSLAVLLAAKTLFWFSGSAIAPAWGAWMAGLTEGVDRERYFARRSAVAQVSLLVSFLSAGAGLYLGQHTAAVQVLPVFVALHGVAVVARAMSAYALHRQATGPAPLPGARPAWAALREAFRASSFRVPAFHGAVLLGAYVAVPFFTPYMLRELRLGYAEFTVLIAAPIVAKIAFYPMLHRVRARLSFTWLLGAAGLGISFVALVWGLTTNFGALIVAQMVSGVAWAALEFGSFQCQLGASPPEHRVAYLSLANSFTGGVQLVSALLGGALLDQLALSYQTVFVISGAGRAAAVLCAFVVLAVESRRSARAHNPTIATTAPASLAEARAELGRARSAVQESRAA